MRHVNQAFDNTFRPEILWTWDATPEAEYSGLASILGQVCIEFGYFSQLGHLNDKPLKMNTSCAIFKQLVPPQDMSLHV